MREQWQMGKFTEERESPTLSSALIDLNFIVSWNRRKLFVPIDWSSSSLQRATSWGLVRLSRVSSSSNSFEKRKISSLLGLSPVSRIWKYGNCLKRHTTLSTTFFTERKIATYQHMEFDTVLPMIRCSSTFLVFKSRYRTLIHQERFENLQDWGDQASPLHDNLWSTVGLPYPQDQNLWFQLSAPWKYCMN